MYTPNEILQYQQDCWKTYKEKLGVFSCPHPGILMREDENGKWKGYLKKIIEEIKRVFET